MKTKLIIEVENCSQCPYVKITRTQGAVMLLIIRVANTLNGIIELLLMQNMMELDNTPPEWCPCRLEE